MLLTRLIKLNMLRHSNLLIAIALLLVLSLSYFAVSNYRVSPAGVKKSLEAYVANEEYFFNTVVSDKATIIAVTVKRDSIVDIKLQHAQTGIFSYAVNDLGNPISVYWSTSQMMVNTSDLKLPDSIITVKYPNGLFELLKKKVLVNGKPFIIAGLIPLHWQYFIENKYLPSQFAGVTNIDKLYRLSDNAYESTAIKSSTGKPLFYIERIEYTNLNQLDVFSTVLHIAIVLLMVVFLIYVAQTLLIKYKFKVAILFLAASLFLLRLIVYYTTFIVFANFTISSKVLLGASVSSSDFLISTIFVFVLVAFLFYFHRRIVYPTKFNAAVAVASL
ncbi:MAG: hypothetical protein M3R72_09475, partial [Bacteroidota bacterium]|nr:hypothetical protein [Bacteroidota bacterium]